MSIRIMSDIWEMPFPPTDKLVFLALADCANDEGLAWPSIATIARKSGVSERTVQRSIRSGEKAGLIRREEVFGKGCKYYFTPRHCVTPDKVSRVTNEALTPDTVSPKPSRTITVSKANALPTRRAKPFQKPDGVEQDVWNDFLDHRKAKRAPISNTAMTAIEREAAKAGWPLNRALAEIVSRNWQSFKAEWVREKQNGHYANQNDGMGITERAAHRALSEITGGDAGFTGRGSQMPQANASGSYRTIDAMPDAVRSIGYAGG